ncbi:MAG: hypothetical protein NTX33_10465 [Propionibacteriales bacterium]|nr:hypothetical protein [Propionibacteriales bacterium]
MRFTRLFTAVVALLMAAIVGFTTTTPSHAAATAAVAAKPAHQISNFSSGPTSTQNVFYAKGLAWTAKGHRIYLQNTTKSRSTWRTIKSTVATADSGRFVFKFSGPVGSKWRIYIKEDAQQRATSQFTYGDSVLHTYFGKIIPS